MPLWPDDVRPEFPEAPFIRPGDPREQMQRIAERQRRTALMRSFASILSMCLGGILIAVGAGFLWGWAAGVVLAGVLIFVVGVLIGLSS